MSVIIITPPPPPPPEKKAAKTSLQDHLINAAAGHPGYKVTVQSTGFVDRLRGLIKSSTAWFNAVVASASSALLAFPDVLLAAQAQVSMLAPALSVKTMAIVGFTLGTISVILRARSVQSRK